MNVPACILAAFAVALQSCSGGGESSPETGRAVNEASQAPVKGSATSPAAPAAATIPGLKSGDVTAMFGDKGFKCIDIGGGGSAAWKCDVATTDHGYVVQVSGSAMDSVVEVKLESTAYAGDPNAVARPFLTNAAVVPYHGADPAVASEWIEANVGRENEISIGGVRFIMSASGETRTVRLRR